MPTINAPERVTQNHVIRFFSGKLHYTYLGDLHDRENSNIMQERLHAWLIGQGYSERLANGAIDRLQRAANDLSQGLPKANDNVYTLLKYGAKVNDENGQPVTVYFLDFDERARTTLPSRKRSRSSFATSSARIWSCMSTASPWR